MSVSAAAAASSSQQDTKLYQVTIKNLDGTTKTVIKSVPFSYVDSNSQTKLFDGVISCVELTQDMLHALWLSAQSDVKADIGGLSTNVIRNVNLFAFKEKNKSEYMFPAELDLNQAKHIASCLFAKKINFIPPAEYPVINDEVDTVEIKAKKRILQKQFNLSAPDDVLDAALNSDSAVIEHFLKINLGYLLYKGSATDFSGRKYESITPLQAAIISGNLDLAKTIKSYFEQLPNGLELMEKQMLELYKRDIANYPNTSHEGAIDNLEQLTQIHQKAQKENVFNFNEVINAINNASKKELEDIVRNPENTRAQWAFVETNTGKPLIDAMNRFRAQFKAKSLSETIPSLHHLREAYKTYDAQYDEWRGDDDTKWLKRDLMARQVIGFVQRFVSAHEAQVSAHGLYLVAERKESPTSSFKYNYGDGAVYPLVGGFSGLGFDNFVSMVGSGRLESWCVGWGWAYDAVGKIMSSKNNKLGELIPKPSVPAAETGCQCVIQ